MAPLKSTYGNLWLVWGGGAVKTVQLDALCSPHAFVWVLTELCRLHLPAHILFYYIYIYLVEGQFTPLMSCCEGLLKQACNHGCRYMYRLNPLKSNVLCVGPLRENKERTRFLQIESLVSLLLVCHYTVVRFFLYLLQ